MVDDAQQVERTGVVGLALEYPAVDLRRLLQLAPLVKANGVINRDIFRHGLGWRLFPLRRGLRINSNSHRRGNPTFLASFRRSKRRQGRSTRRAFSCRTIPPTGQERRHPRRCQSRRALTLWHARFGDAFFGGFNHGTTLPWALRTSTS